MLSNSKSLQIKLLDVSGKVLEICSSVIKGSAVKIGNGLKAGTYFAEVRQGNNKQVLKLIKLN